MILSEDLVLYVGGVTVHAPNYVWTRPDTMSNSGNLLGISFFLFTGNHCPISLLPG